MMSRFLFLFTVILFLSALQTPVWSSEAEDEKKMEQSRDSIPEEQANQEPPATVPILTFRQQVDCVVTAKKNPVILQAKIEQKQHIIESDLVIANTQNREQAKKLAIDFIRLIKQKSLDEDPTKEKIGKGLYTYKIQVSRANKAVLATGVKRFNETDIQWAIKDDGAKDEAILEDD